MAEWMEKNYCAARPDLRSESTFQFRNYRSPIPHDSRSFTRLCSHFVHLCYKKGPFVSSGLIGREEFPPNLNPENIGCLPQPKIGDE